MLGYLASGWSCPRCDAAMSEIQGQPDSRYCAVCSETFHLQLGHLVATGATDIDIDLTDTTIDLTGADVRGPIETAL
jgi:hypothetical protein